MALTRTIQLSFWTDSKVVDDFTPEDRYFYLYLMTNPHTNVCGCYEISLKQMSDETGYTKETVEKLLARMMNIHKVICYSQTTKEMLLLNWSKYNWTQSDKFRIAVEREIERVKDLEFQHFLEDLYNEVDTVSIRYPYGMDTSFSLYSNTLNNINSLSNNLNKIDTNNNFINMQDNNLSEDYKALHCNADVTQVKRLCNTEIEIDKDLEIKIDKEIDKDTRKEKRRSGVFTPPTLAEVQNYCHEKGFTNVDAERFIDFYESKGWMVGRNKMKDWKASVRNWERDKRSQKNSTGSVDSLQKKHEDFVEMWRNA